MNYFSKFLTISCFASLLIGCGGGGSSSNSDTPSNNGTTAVAMTAPVSYPTGINNQANRIPLVVANSGSKALNNLTYSIANNTTGGTITIDYGKCNNLAVNSGNCTVYATVSANAHAGSFTLQATAASSNITDKFISKIKSLIDDSTPTLSTTIGLEPLPDNQESGAAGVTLLYPDAVLGNLADPTKVIVTAVVTSATAGNFNTINLVDSAGNHLDAEPLFGNSGSGLSNLGQYSVVPILLTIPAGTRQTVFYAQLAKNGSVVSTAAKNNANTIQVISSATPTGILNMQPNYSVLNSDYTQQVLTLTNSGNGSLNNLTITTGNNLSKLNTTCGSSLAAGASCNYTIQFDAANPIGGSSTVVASYNATSSTNLSYAKTTVHYTGTNAVAGLKISSSDTLNFIATTANPTQSALVTLTNTGNNIESLVISSLPDIFSLNTTDVDNPCALNKPLAPEQSCNLRLVYTNPTVTAESIVTLSANYTYLTATGSATASTSTTVSYQTNQSYASLAILPKDLAFNSIINNNHDQTSQKITIQNQGDGTATNLSSLLTGNTFTIADNSCGNALASGESCNLTINFGPTTAAAEDVSGKLAISYSPYSGAAVQTDSIDWNATILQAGAANPAVNLTESSGFVFGSGTSTFPYHVQQETPASLVYTISNTSSMPASNFHISADTGLADGWNIDTAATTCGSAQAPINLAADSSCKLVINLTTTTSGSFELDLSKLTMSWNDQLHPDGTAIAVANNTIYATVFPGPSIQITTSQGTPESVGTIAANESFVITATLSGGYQVGEQNVIVSATSKEPPVSVTPDGCFISSNNSSCKITITAHPYAQPGVYDNQLQITNKGSVAFTPTNINFEIIKSWQIVGNTGISAGMVREPILKIYNNIPYVAYIDIANESRVTVMKFENNVWQPVGNPGFSAPAVKSASLNFAIDSNGIPYIAFAQEKDNRLTIMKFINDTWQSLNPISQGSIYSLSLALDSDNNPYVAYRDPTTSRATVVKYVAESWQVIGEANFSKELTIGLRLALDHNNVPYVIFEQYTGESRIYDGIAMSLSSNSWQQIGIIPSLLTNSPYIAINSSGLPYIAYSTDHNINIIRYSPDLKQWNSVSNAGLGSGGSLGMVFDTNNFPYIVFTNNSTASSVMKLNGNSWEYLGVKGALKGNNPTLALDSSNTPYVAYMDYANAKKATVMTYR